MSNGGYTVGLLPGEIAVDLFAGGGGASVGIRSAIGHDPHVAINHDRTALAMHEANHPDTWHLRDDIRNVPPRWASRRRPVGLLWASPDCKHFSKAKGAAPKRSREIRSLAWAVERWARETRPRVIILENVEEFRSWGPLDRNGKIVKAHAGDTYRAFTRRLRRLGYRVEERELKACDYGAPTIRKRLFMIARCDGMPIVWPAPTHGPGLLPYRTAADIIDWSIPCPSIFDRKKPLVDNTLRRIAEGIRRYVVETDSPYIVSSSSGEMAPFLTEHANGSSQRTFNAKEPLRTQCANVKGGHFALVVPHISRQFGCGVGSKVDSPVGTITPGGQGKAALVAAFLAKHYTGVVGHEIDKPAGTITTADHHSIVTSHLLKLRGTCKDGQAVNEPMPALTAGGNHVGEVRAFLMKYYGCGSGQNLAEPTHTLTTKDRFGLVTVNVGGEPYVITDIGMRMLQPRELFLAQGFPEDFIIDVNVPDELPTGWEQQMLFENFASGKPITKTAQVRCCGNSVCPPLAKALVEANVTPAVEMPAAS